MGIWSYRDFKKRIKNPYENMTAVFYMRQMEKIARSMFKWECSEKNITGALIERYLWDSFPILWENADLGWIVTGAHATAYDVNSRPIRFRPIFDKPIAGITCPSELTIDECIPIFEWSNHEVKRKDALFLAFEMADVNETIRTQVFNQKTPIIAISGSDQKRLKTRNFLVDVGENMKMFVLDSDLTEDVKALDFNAPFNVPDLWAHKKAIYNEFLEWIGVDSQDAYQKKERKVVSEQEANNEQINYVLADQLNERLKACERAKDFGISLSVEVQKSVRPSEDRMLNDETLGGDYETNPAV